MSGNDETPRPHVVHRVRPALSPKRSNADGVSDYLAGYFAAQDDSRADG